MKQKIIILAVAFAVALTAAAQSPFYKKCEGNRDLTTVFVTKQLILNMDDTEMNIGGMPGMSFLKEKIDNIQIVSSNNDKGKKFILKNLSMISPENGYELIVKVNEHAEDAAVYCKKLGKDRNRFVIAVRNTGRTVITIEGPLTLEDIMSNLSIRKK